MKSLEKTAEFLLMQDPELVAAFERLQIPARSISVLEETGFVTVLASCGYPPGLINAFRRFSIEEPLPLSDGLRNGTTIWLANAEEHEARYPSSIATFTSNSERLGWAVIPFMLAPETRCALAVSFRAGQVLTPAVRAETEALVESIARRLQSAVAA